MASMSSTDVNLTPCTTCAHTLQNRGSRLDLKVGHWSFFQNHHLRSSLSKPCADVAVYMSAWPNQLACAPESWHNFSCPGLPSTALKSSLEPPHSALPGPPSSWCGVTSLFRFTWSTTSLVLFLLFPQEPYLLSPLMPVFLTHQKRS